VYPLIDWTNRKSIEPPDNSSKHAYMWIMTKAQIPLARLDTTRHDKLRHRQLVTHKLVGRFHHQCQLLPHYILHTGLMQCHFSSGITIYRALGLKGTRTNIFWGAALKLVQVLKLCETVLKLFYVRTTCVIAGNWVIHTK